MSKIISLQSKKKGNRECRLRANKLRSNLSLKKRSNAGVQNLNVCSCIVSVFLRVLFVIANVSVINVGIMCSLNRKGRKLDKLSSKKIQMLLKIN